MDDGMSVWAKFEGYDAPEEEAGPGEVIISIFADGQRPGTAAKQIVDELCDTCEDLPEWLAQEDIVAAVRTALHDGEADLSKGAGEFWVRIRWDHETE